MSSTCTQSQLCTATPISCLCPLFTFHFSHCFRLWSHLLSAKSRRGNHVSSGTNRYIWYSPLKFNLHSERTLCSYSNFISLSSVYICHSVTVSISSPMTDLIVNHQQWWLTIKMHDGEQWSRGHKCLLRLDGLLLTCWRLHNVYCVATTCCFLFLYCHFFMVYVLIKVTCWIPSDHHPS